MLKGMDMKVKSHLSVVTPEMQEAITRKLDEEKKSSLEEMDQICQIKVSEFTTLGEFAEQRGVKVSEVIVLCINQRSNMDTIKYKNVKLIRAVDGDDITFQSPFGKKEKVRLWGIDAPEYDQPGGEEAKKALQELIDIQPIGNIEIKHRDKKHKRDVVVVYPSSDIDLSHSLNVQMIRLGWAEHATNFAPDEQEFAKAQEAARKAKRGMWE